MNYYKIMDGDTVIDVNNVFLRWQQKHRVIIGCEPSEAHYIRSSDGAEIYRVPWLNALPEGAAVFDTADAVEIGEDEYNSLRERLDSGESVEAEAETAVEDETAEETPESAVMTAAEMRREIVSLKEQLSGLRAVIDGMSNEQEV